MSNMNVLLIGKTMIKAGCYSGYLAFGSIGMEFGLRAELNSGIMSQESTFHELEMSQCLPPIWSPAKAYPALLYTVKYCYTWVGRIIIFWYRGLQVLGNSIKPYC